MKKAVIVGVTGEVGRNILKILIDKNYYDKIYLLGRKSIFNIPNYDKIEKIVVNFENLEFDFNILNNADIFWSLGTRPSFEFEKIDYIYPTKFAKICENKIKSFNFVSSIATNEKIKIPYSHFKGKTEIYLRTLNLGFVRIYKPSLLIAPQRTKMFNFEKVTIPLFIIINNLLIFKLKNWRGIRSYDLANNMVINAINTVDGGIYKYKDMFFKNH